MMYTSLAGFASVPMNEHTLQPEMKFENLPDILTVQQTRTILGIGRTAVYRLLECGEIRCFKIGNAYKIPKALK